jgi:carotenoid cleavage dioxygenase-like enzyme
MHYSQKINVEFPRVDERFVGHNNRHAYMNGTINKNLPNLFDAIIHYDVKNNKKQIHHFGDGSFALEPIFIPRSADSHEGDGFLLSYVYREALNRSDLVILDAQHVDAEPLAIVQFPHRVPFGFYGCWVNKIPIDPHVT